MALKFLYNGTTYTCTGETTKPSTVQAIGFTDTDGTTKYLWASTSRGTAIQVYKDSTYLYKINNSSPSICFTKGGTTYYAAKSITKSDNPERTFSGSYTISWSLSWYTSGGGFYAGGGGISKATITLNRAMGKTFYIRPAIWYGDPKKYTSPYYAGSSVTVSSTQTSITLSSASNGGQLGNQLWTLTWGFQVSTNNSTWTSYYQGSQSAAQKVQGTYTGSTTLTI